MPVSHRIDREQKVVYSTFEGEVTDLQLAQHASEIRSDPEIDDTFVELILADKSSMNDVTTSGVRQAAAAVQAVTTLRKIGIVASQDVEFGLARMVELLADGSLVEVRAFRQEAEARSWLGIE